jgi:anti-sigma factor RsiW
MGRIISFAGDPHREARDLMPWLISGQLAPEERARVEAHIQACEECARDLAAERDLASGVAELPIATGVSWSAMHDRLDAAASAAQPQPRPSTRRFTLRQIGAFAAAQAALLAAAVSITARTAAPVASYHALGAVPAAAPGNLIVVFRPDVRESDMRRLLKDSDARLVDGPTAANAYVLRVPDTERASTLAHLRGAAEVVLAEPLDTAALR